MFDSNKRLAHMYDTINKPSFFFSAKLNLNLFAKEKVINPDSKEQAMLDLEKRTPEQEQTAENALQDEKLLFELLENMLSKDNKRRYECFKVVYLISEDHPEALYPKWDYFKDMLESKNSASTFQAIHILANLAKVDSEGRFQQSFDSFYRFLNGEELIPASHVAYVSHKIVKAKPELADAVAEKLLNLDEATYKHKDLVQAEALKSISEFFDKVSDKSKVAALAKELQESKGRAKKESSEFLKKWNLK
jgi:hypothetical protein